MKSQDVIAAFRAFATGDRERAMEIIGQIEANETRYCRHVAATQLRKIAMLSSGSSQQLVKLPNAPDTLRTITAERSLQSVITSDQVLSEVMNVIREWNARDSLIEHGIKPRTNIFMNGPSGNGKTCLAEAIAFELNKPLAVVDYSELIDSHVGTTGRNIGKVMQFARTNSCVLLFDEADSLISVRGPGNDAATRESNRVTNQVLIDLDTLGCNSVVIFATNFEGSIDTALRRRIQVTIEMPAPTSIQKRWLVGNLLKKWSFINEFSIENLNESLSNLESFAAVEEFITNIARKHIIEKASKHESSQGPQEKNGRSQSRKASLAL